MTDKDFDDYFLGLLKKIENELKETLDYYSTYELKEYKSIRKKLNKEIEVFQKVQNKITQIEDLASFSDKIIDIVYENIYDYASNFIITIENRNKDLYEYNVIQNILEMFCDNEDDDYE